MILTGKQIKIEIEKKAISIAPFNPKFINPNSYNYHLGDYLLVIDDEEIDMHSQSKTRRIDIPKKGFLLKPHKLYLGFTQEYIGSSKYVPSLIGRSSMGRLGLFLQITADLGHVGTNHRWTLELTVVQPLVIYPGMQIGQISFWETEGLDLLNGKLYQSQQNNYARYSRPAPSIIKKLFEDSL